MSSRILECIADGRTDLVFDYVANGHAANSADHGGTPLITWCAYYGDVSAIRFLLSHGETLDTLGPNLGLDGAAFHGHWQLCQFLKNLALGAICERIYGNGRLKGAGNVDRVRVIMLRQPADKALQRENQRWLRTTLNT
jgi:hypothetical protein